MVTVTLTNGQIITGDFPDRRQDETLKLGAVFQIWADKVCGTTAGESLCVLMRAEDVREYNYSAAEAAELRAAGFRKIAASGIPIPELFTEETLLNLEKD